MCLTCEARIPRPSRRTTRYLRSYKLLQLWSRPHRPTIARARYLASRVRVASPSLATPIRTTIITATTGRQNQPHTVAALDETANELQVRPHSPPYEGGVAVTSRKGPVPKRH